MAGRKEMPCIGYSWVFGSCVIKSMVGAIALLEVPSRRDTLIDSISDRAMAFLPLDVNGNHKQSKIQLKNKKRN